VRECVSACCGAVERTLKASLNSSSWSLSFILLAIMVKNSAKSIVPLPVKETRFMYSNDVK